MRIDGRDYKTIWPDPDGRSVHVIDQTGLPHRFATRTLASLHDAVRAIADMIVRGAPLIGVTGAYGLALAVADDASDTHINVAYAELLTARPTAVNLLGARPRAGACARRAAERETGCCLQGGCPDRRRGRRVLRSHRRTRRGAHCGLGGAPSRKADKYSHSLQRRLALRRR